MRYVPHTDQDREAMLATIGVESIDDLFAPIPKELRAPRELPFLPALSEPELQRHLTELAGRNVDLGSRPSFLGGGCYRHYVPAVVDALASRGEFLTAYTPYQAEASQGTLQAVYEFQSMVAEIADLPVTNASLYDGATALGEALLMAHALAPAAEGQPTRTKVLLSKGVHPEYRRTAATYYTNLPYTIEELDLGPDGRTAIEALSARAGEAVAFAFQSPSFAGTIEDARALADAAHARGCRVIQVFNPIAAALLTPPGEAGADIAVGDGQCLGNYPNYGGPHLGLIAAKEDFLRRLPGRVVGKTRDLDGHTAYVLTLQTREQHIRRERATSNICTNVGLIALRAAIHMATLGKEGLRTIARICLERAHFAAREIAKLPGYKLRYPGAPFFHEVAVVCPRSAADVNRALDARGIIGGLDLGRFEAEESATLLLCFTEMTNRADIDRLIAALAEIGGKP